MVWEVSHANTAHLCNSLKLLPFNGNRIFMRTFQSSFLKLKFAKAASKLARNTFDCIYSDLLWFDISQNYIVIVLRPFFQETSLFDSKKKSLAEIAFFLKKKTLFRDKHSEFSVYRRVPGSYWLTK